MPVITLLNQKGGVGKTSTTHHLGGTFALQGHRLLLVDNDPQASLTQGFWGPQATLALDPAMTIAAVYRGDRLLPEHVIQPSGITNIDLIPGSDHATSYNIPDPHRADSQSQQCLRELLTDVRDSYNLILIDCPPNLHLCSFAALVASDYVLVPLQPEDYGAQGIIAVQRSISLVQGGPNPELAILGFLITMVQPRRTVHQLYEERLRAAYGPDVFETRIPEAADYVEAIARRLPIAQYKPKSAAAKTIKALAAELEARLQAVESANRTEAA